MCSATACSLESWSRSSFLLIHYSVQSQYSRSLVQSHPHISTLINNCNSDLKLQSIHSSRRRSQRYDYPACIIRPSKVKHLVKHARTRRTPFAIRLATPLPGYCCFSGAVVYQYRNRIEPNRNQRRAYIALKFEVRGEQSALLCCVVQLQWNKTPLASTNAHA